MMTERRIRSKMVGLEVGTVIELNDFDKWVVVETAPDPEALWRVVDTEGIPELAPESVLLTLRAIK